MMIDQQEYNMAGGVIVYPDFPFAAPPKQPDQIKETVTLKGVIGRIVNIMGSADQNDQ